MKRARKKGNNTNINSVKAEEKEYIKNENDYKINKQDEQSYRLKYFGESEMDEENENTQPAEENILETEEKNEDTSENIEESIPAEDETPDVPELEHTKEIVIPDSKKPSDNPGKKTETKVKKYAVIFSVSLLVIIFASVFALSMGGMFNKGNDIDEYVEPVDEKMGKINVLLLGVDKEGLRTDTIIVASYDMDENKVNLLSIPRDTRMYIGQRYQKINAAHAISKKSGKIAGPEGTIEAVTRLTGIPINYYVEFSFKAFRETIDALGGVYFDVPQNMYYKDPTQDLYINLKKGYQLLDGDKAEQLVRFRSYPEGDIKRVRVQQSFIKAVAEQKLNASILENVSSLYKTLTKNIKTNLRVTDAIKYAKPLMNLNFENITMYELPGDYSGEEYSASYWLVDMNETRRLIESVFGYDTTYTTNKKAIANAVYGKETDPERLQALLAGELDEKAETPPKKEETKQTSDEEKEDTSVSATSKSNDDEDDDKNTVISSQTDDKNTIEPEKTTQDEQENTSSPSREETEKADENKEPQPEPDNTQDNVSDSEQPVRPSANEMEDSSNEDTNSGFERPKPN